MRCLALSRNRDVREGHRCLSSCIRLRILSITHGWRGRAERYGYPRVRLLVVRVPSVLTTRSQRYAWVRIILSFGPMVHLVSFDHIRCCAAHVGPTSASCLPRRPLVRLLCATQRVQRRSQQVDRRAAHC